MKNKLLQVFVISLPIGQSITITMKLCNWLNWSWPQVISPTLFIFTCGILFIGFYLLVNILIKLGETK